MAETVDTIAAAACGLFILALLLSLPVYALVRLRRLTRKGG